MKSKSVSRTKLLDSVVKALKSPDVYDTINYRKMNESRIKQFIYPYLLNTITTLYKTHDKISEETARNKARESLLWEGNINTTISNNLFMGTSHRPDMVVEFNDIRIAIEIKRGCDGTNIREGIGQTLVYSNIFDFTICLFIDTTKDKRILNASTSKEESSFIKDLWRKHNIRFEVV
jgi:hypothetical protein